MISVEVAGPPSAALHHQWGPIMLKQLSEVVPLAPNFWSASCTPSWLRPYNVWLSYHCWWKLALDQDILIPRLHPVFNGTHSLITIPLTIVSYSQKHTQGDSAPSLLSLIHRAYISNIQIRKRWAGIHLHLNTLSKFIKLCNACAYIHKIPVLLWNLV